MAKYDWTIKSYRFYRDAALHCLKIAKAARQQGNLALAKHCLHCAAAARRNAVNHARIDY